MLRLMRRLCRKDERGATMTEYIIMIVILAIAIGAALVAFRGKVKEKVDDAGTSVEGMKVEQLE